MSNEFPQFDPSQVPPSTGAAGKSLPISDKQMGHLVVISDDEIVQTKAGDGQWYLQLTLEIIEGTHKGETGVHRLNMGNADPTAVRIAYQELSAICHCVGFLQPLNTVDPIKGKPFRVIVDYQKGEDAKNKGYTEIKAIRDSNGNKPGEGNKPGPSPGPAPGPSAPPPPPQPQSAPQQPPAQNTGFPPQGPPAPQQPPQGQYQQQGAPPAPQQPPFPPQGQQGQQQQQGPPPGYSNAPPQQPQGQAQVQNVPWGAPPQQ